MPGPKEQYVPSSGSFVRVIDHTLPVVRADFRIIGQYIRMPGHSLSI